jgi:hypothetical protein
MHTNKSTDHSMVLTSVTLHNNTLYLGGMFLKGINPYLLPFTLSHPQPTYKAIPLPKEPVMQSQCNKVFTQSVHYCCPTKKKSKMFEQIFVKLPNIKLKENSFSSSQAVTCKQTERHVMLIGAFLQLSLWLLEKETHM